jgi:HSP90 family molecular chaperone
MGIAIKDEEKEILAFQAEVKQLLDIMIHSFVGPG